MDSIGPESAAEVRPRAAASAVPEIASWRLAVDRQSARFYEAAAHLAVCRWLALCNGAVALFLALPFAAPALMAVGLATPAAWIYASYSVVCHQWAFRSYFLFGERLVYPPEVLRALVGEREMFGFIGNPQLGFKVAFCERDVAIFAAILLAGLAFSRVRDRLRPPSLPMLALLLLPIAADGFTQLFGLRESTWELRTATGALFGVATVWLIYPQVERSARRARHAYGLE